MWWFAVCDCGGVGLCFGWVWWFAVCDCGGVGLCFGWVWWFTVVAVCDVWVCVLGGCGGLWFAVVVVAGGGDRFGGLDYWDFSGFWIFKKCFLFIYFYFF